MKVIPRKYHAALDYIYGIFVITSPWILNFNRFDSATDVAYLWGLTVLLYSLNTDYEGGASKVISMETHLKLDIAGGLLIAASPWLIGFNDQTFMLHLAAGGLSVVVGILTTSKSEHPNAHHVDDVLRQRN